MLKQALDCPVLKVFEGGLVVGVPPTAETIFPKGFPHKKKREAIASRFFIKIISVAASLFFTKEDAKHREHLQRGGKPHAAHAAKL